MNKRTFILSLTLSMFMMCATLNSAPILELSPVNGKVRGSPGQVVGWGFNLTNYTDFMVVTSANFLPHSSIGSFTDFIAQFNFVVVGPAPDNPIVFQSFDPTALTGIGSFAISREAMPNDFVVGQIELTYDLFSRSPNDSAFNPMTDTLSTGNLLTAKASVAVVPEPSGLLLVTAALLLMSRWKPGPLVL